MVTVIPNVIGAFGTIPNGLVKGLEDLEIRGQVKIIQTTLLLSARILRRVLDTCCHSSSIRKPSALADRKNSQKNSNNNDMFPEKQKECCKWTRGTWELLYIDQQILNENKMRRKN